MRKPFVILMFVLLANAAACSRIEQEVVSTLLSNYVTAQEALASDDLVLAVHAFDGTAADSDGELEKMILAISEAEDLEVARSRFKELSEQVLEMELPEGFVMVHCPDKRGQPGGGCYLCKSARPIGSFQLGVDFSNDRLVDQATEELTRLFCHFSGQIESSVKHGEQDAFDLEPGIERLLDEANGI